jgi:hypothetical protein
LIYKCGGIDKRTIEKFEKVSYIRTRFAVAVRSFLLIAACVEWAGGAKNFGGVGEEIARTSRTLASLAVTSLQPPPLRTCDS